MVVDDLQGVVISADIISQSEDVMKSKNEKATRGSERASLAALDSVAFLMFNSTGVQTLLSSGAVAFSRCQGASVDGAGVNPRLYLTTSSSQVTRSFLKFEAI